MKDKSGRWEQRDNRRRWVRIPSQVPHQVTPVTAGRRYSRALTAENNSALHKLGKLGGKLGYPVTSYVPSDKHAETMAVSLSSPDSHQSDRQEQSSRLALSILFIQPGYVAEKDWSGQWDQVLYLPKHQETRWPQQGKCLMIVKIVKSEEQKIPWSVLVSVCSRCSDVSVYCEYVSGQRVQQRLLEQGTPMNLVTRKIEFFREEMMSLCRHLCLEFGVHAQPWTGEFSNANVNEAEAYPTEEQGAGNDCAPFPAGTDQQLLSLIKRAHDRLGHPHMEQCVVS